MHVHVKNRLARAWTDIQDRAVSIFDASLPRNFRGREMTTANYFSVFFCGLFQPGNMFFRNNEHMSRRFRVNVLEGECVRVFVHFLGGNLVPNNFAEEAIARI